jgi:hypothetical protein
MGADHRALHVVEILHPANVLAGHQDEARDDAPGPRTKP